MDDVHERHNVIKRECEFSHNRKHKVGMGVNRTVCSRLKCACLACLILCVWYIILLMYICLCISIATSTATRLKTKKKRKKKEKIHLHSFLYILNDHHWYSLTACTSLTHTHTEFIRNLYFSYH